MSIKDLEEKIKGGRKTLLNTLKFKENAEKYFFSIIIILVGLSSFGLGRLSVYQGSKTEIVIEKNKMEIKKIGEEIVNSKNLDAQKASVIKSLQPGGKFVASKTGSKYYFPWCGSVANIADKNKVWFSSEAEAKTKGYAPASNCKGLK